MTDLRCASDHSSEAKSGEHAVVVVWLYDHSDLLDGFVILISRTEIMQRVPVPGITIGSCEIYCDSQGDLGTSAKIIDESWNFNELEVQEFDLARSLLNFVNSRIDQLISSRDYMTDLFIATH